MKRFTMISVMIVAIISVILLININIIFQEGNPITVFRGIFPLSSSETFVKIKDNPVTYVTITDDADDLFAYIEESDNVSYKEQVGLGHIFENRNKVVILTSRQYTRNYQIWEYSKKDFKVVGYYSGDLFNEPVENLQTDKLTHVMYAFLIPRADGSLVDLEKPEQLKKLVEQAHDDKAKVFISLGGWSYEGEKLEPVFKEIASSDETRKFFVNNVRDFVDEYNLDGVELDWEHPNNSTAEDYEKLVTELSDALVSQGRELSAALNGSWYDDWGGEEISVITKNSLDRFSFINVMSYDMNNDEHSPMWFFENSLDYWLNRGVSPEKIVMGLPLYAKPSRLQYRQLVDMHPDYAYIDYAPTAPLESYYNGLNTLREKTSVALKRAGGVMLFDVNEDASDDEYSAVSMIYRLLNEEFN
ncbi:MAG TPA: hypothetical protein DCM73_05345 [Clostridiales bacterium]|nr:hypothetical protein [Clostridiales bacterium]